MPTALGNRVDALESSKFIVRLQYESCLATLKFYLNTNLYNTLPKPLFIEEVEITLKPVF